MILSGAIIVDTVTPVFLFFLRAVQFENDSINTVRKRCKSHATHMLLT